MKKTLLLSVFFSLLFSSLSVRAELGMSSENMFPPPPSADECCASNGKPSPHCDIKQRLNLTEEQKIKAHTLRVNTREKIKPVIEELKSKESLKMQLQSTGADSNQIRQVGLEIKRLRGQLNNLIMQNERDFMQILTTEQKDEFNKIREERKKEFSRQRN